MTLVVASALGAIGFGVLGLLGGLTLVGPLTTKAYLRVGDVSRRGVVARGQVVWAATLGAVLVGGTTAPHQPLLAVALLMVSVVAVWVSAVDIDVHRIPNAASGLAAMTSLTYVVVDGAITAEYPQAIFAVLTAAAVGLAGLGVAWLGAAGLGDVKLLAALVPLPAYVGPGALALMTAFVVLGGLVVGLLFVRLRRDESARLPAGPVIMYGVLAGLCAWDLVS